MCQLHHVGKAHRVPFLGSAAFQFFQGPKFEPQRLIGLLRVRMYLEDRSSLNIVRAQKMLRLNTTG